MGKSMRRRGQGMTEYIIIVALIAIAAIGVISLFGDDIRILFGGATNALAGNESTTVKPQAAQAHHTDHKTLKNFSEKNTGVQ